MHAHPPFSHGHRPSENVFDRAKHALEAVTVELDALHVALCSDSGVALVVLEERNLAKVVCAAKLAHLAFLTLVVLLCDNHLAIHNDEKLLALVALLHNRLAVLK